MFMFFRWGNRLREVRSHAQGPTAREWQSRDSPQGLSFSATWLCASAAEHPRVALDRCCSPHPAPWSPASQLMPVEGLVRYSEALRMWAQRSCLILGWREPGLSVVGSPGGPGWAGFPRPRAERVSFPSRQKEEAFGVWGGRRKWVVLRSCLGKRGPACCFLLCS